MSEKITKITTENNEQKDEKNKEYQIVIIIMTIYLGQPVLLLFKNEKNEYTLIKRKIKDTNITKIIKSAINEESFSTFNFNNSAIEKSVYYESDDDIIYYIFLVSNEYEPFNHEIFQHNRKVFKHFTKGTFLDLDLFSINKLQKNVSTDKHSLPVICKDIFGKHHIISTECLVHIEILINNRMFDFFDNEKIIYCNKKILDTLTFFDFK